MTTDPAVTIQPDVERLLSPDQTARYLGISRRSLERLRDRGEGPAFYVISELTQTRRYDVRDLNEWLRTARREPSAS